MRINCVFLTVYATASNDVLREKCGIIVLSKERLRVALTTGGMSAKKDLDTMNNNTISIQCRMKYYVYQLRAINSKTPFYIGKGTDGRSRAHFTAARKGSTTYPQYKEVQKFWQSGVAVVDEVLFYTEDEQLAFAVERSYIASYSGYLVNQRQTVEDYHPKRIKKPVLEYPRLQSHSPFPYHYVKGWRNQYKLHSVHESIADRIAMLIHANPVKLITDDKCQCFDEVSFK